MISDRLLKDKFFRNNAIVFLGSLVISLLSYLYYPILARLMTLETFGEVQTLISIFTQALLFFSAINIVTVVLVSNNKNQNESFLIELQKMMVYLVIIFGTIAIIFSPFLKTFFNFQSVWPFIAMVAALITSVPFIFWSSFLQGKQNFGGMNFLGICGAGAKLVTSVLLVMAGFGSLGAIAGLFFGQAIALYLTSRRYSLPPLRQLFSSSLPKWRHFNDELKYTVLVLLSTLMITMLYSGDILLVKHYASPAAAGAYAGIASIARIVFFLTFPFAVVLLPAINSDTSNRTALLKRSFKLVVLFGSSACLVFWAFSDQIINLLIGPRYVELSGLLPKLSLAVFMISISNLFIYFLLSLRSILSLYTSLIGFVFFLVLSIMKHATLNDIVDNLLIASALTLTLLIIVLSIWPRIRAFTRNQDYISRLAADEE